LLISISAFVHLYVTQQSRAVLHTAYHFELVIHSAQESSGVAHAVSLHSGIRMAAISMQPAGGQAA
jgi:hypothetical protein